MQTVKKAISMKEKKGQNEVKADDAPKEDIYSKVYNNGHKTLTAPEAKALSELLASENRKRENFHKNKQALIRPRDPLAGGITPRNIYGEVVMNPNALMTVTKGIPLFPPDAPPAVFRPSHEPVGKIGVVEERYRNTLGNRSSDNLSAPANPDDLFARTHDDLTRKQHAREEQEKIAAMKMKVSAQRHEKNLVSEIQQLKAKLGEKERELRVLRQKYDLSDNP